VRRACPHRFAGEGGFDARWTPADAIALSHACLAIEHADEGPCHIYGDTGLPNAHSLPHAHGGTAIPYTNAPRAHHAHSDASIPNANTRSLPHAHSGTAIPYTNAPRAHHAHDDAYHVRSSQEPGTANA
jgi:hypothetical protein